MHRLGGLRPPYDENVVSEYSPEEQVRASQDRESLLRENIADIVNLLNRVTNRNLNGPMEENNVRNHELSGEDEDYNILAARFEHLTLSEDREQLVIDVVLLSSLLRRSQNHEDIKELASVWLRTSEVSLFEAVRGITQLLFNTACVMVSVTRQEVIFILEEFTVEQINSQVDISRRNEFISNFNYMDNLCLFLRLIIDRQRSLENILIRNIERVLNLCGASSWPLARYAAILIGSKMTSQYSSYLAEYRAATEVTANIAEAIDDCDQFFKLFLKIVTRGLEDSVLSIRKVAYSIFFRFILNRDQAVMKDEFLRYLYRGLLSDESAAIRKYVIDCFISLFKLENLVTVDYETFLWKMVPAIGARTRDVSSKVAISAMNAIAEVYKKAPFVLNLLNLDISDYIYTLVYSQDAAVANNATAYTYEIFKHISSDNIEFLHNTICFAYESVGVFSQEFTVSKDKMVKTLVHRLIVYSIDELTDWDSWTTVLLSDHFANSRECLIIKCTILLEVIDHIAIAANVHQGIEQQYPLLPPSKVQNPSVSFTEPENSKHGQSLKKLKSLVKTFGMVLTTIWNKYKMEDTCLKKLVTLPQYFYDGQFEPLEEVDVKGLCVNLVYLTKVKESSQLLSAIYRSIATIYNYMLKSKMWIAQVPTLDLILFNPTKQFMDACSTIRYEESCENQLRALHIIKCNLYLSMYFDVTKTPLLECALKALELGTKRNQEKVINPAAMICLYLIQWQLRNLDVAATTRPSDPRIVVKNIRSKGPLLVKIRSQGQLFFKQLDQLIRHENQFIRDTAFSVMCRLITTLCTSNKFAAPYPDTHLPPLTTISCEWLNYSLHCQLPKEKMPKDLNFWEDARRILRLFCLVLELGVMNPIYSTSLLMYFRYYSQPINFNQELGQFFWSMNEKVEHFPQLVIDGLIWLEIEQKVNAKELGKGVITTIACNMPIHSVQKVAAEFVTYGLTKIQKVDNHFIFEILVPFIKYLEPTKANLIGSEVRRTFIGYHETPSVKGFLTAFDRVPRRRHRGAVLLYEDEASGESDSG